MELIATEKGTLTPIKAIPEEMLNKLILGEWMEEVKDGEKKMKLIRPGLSDWLSDILSLKNNSENVKRLAQVLPMIKESAWSMNIVEIKKAFTMYVKGQLPGLEPRDNYLTPILFSSVMNTYKQQRKPKKQEVSFEITDEEKERNAYLNCIYAYDEWKQEKKLPNDYHWVYETLKERGLLKVSEEESKSLNEHLRETYPHFNKEQKKIKGRIILLERFFERLKVHVKELLV